MLRMIISSLFYCFPFLLFGQLQDDFSDGNLSSNPTWLGDVDSFVVNAALEMQLMSTAAGEATTYTSLSIPDSLVWEIYLRLEFAPSGSNKLRIYLQADQSDLQNSNGYFLEVGESGSADALRLYRQDGGIATLLASGTAGTMGSEPAEARLQLRRSANGTWRMAADYTGGQQLMEEFEITDNTYSSGAAYFGFNCTYTDSRKDKYFFDDIVVRELLPDTSPPSLQSIQVTSDNSLSILFDESLDVTAAEMLNNYQVDGTIGSPSVANVDGANPALVHLEFSNGFVNGQAYQLTASNIADTQDNIASPQIASFIYFLVEDAEPFDILINEILADPTPPNTLPDAEYIELYNRSAKVIDLGRLQFGKSSGSQQSLPAGLLLPGEYILLTDDSDVSELTTFGEVIGLASFPALTNTGDELLLTTSGGTIIHQVNYTDDWYQDTDKAMGGWSLELINPELYCQQGFNWIASNDSRGGTPASQNSVFSDVADTEGPRLLNALPISEREVRLFFSEILAPEVADPALYSIQPTSGAIINVSLEVPNLNTVLIEIEAPFFEDATTYTLTLTDGVTDCSGNAIVGEQTIGFAYFEPRFPTPFDVLITEVMADPTLESGETLGLPDVEYIELYNRSDQVLNLENYTLSDRSDDIRLPYYLLFPNSYVLLYPSGSALFSTTSDTLPLDDFLSLGNESDDLELRSQDGSLIHALYYSKKWYRNSAKDDGGWSLEMIDTEQPCLGIFNWQASDNLLGGTPGVVNSVAATLEPEPGPQLLRVFPLTDNQLQLTFDRFLSPMNAEIRSHYFIEGFEVLTANVEFPFINVVTITVDGSFEEGLVYELQVLTSISDCIGSLGTMEQKAFFGLPEAIEPGDMIINELLFNPETGGSRFIELYNRSDKIVNAGDLVLARRDELDEIDQAEPVLIDYLVFPDSFVVFTDNPIDIETRYTVKTRPALLNNEVPTYGDKGGKVVVLRPGATDAILIDEFWYSNAFHNALLDDENGVSLERIDPEGPSQSEANWHSAAQAAGFATPTYQNSQFIKESNPGADLVSIDNNTLSPDGDGFEDFLLINFQTQQNGFVANVQIFDAAGRSIKELAKNELLALEAQLKWDGVMDDGSKARMGIYIVWVELFAPDGAVKHWKDTIVVAGRLE